MSTIADALKQEIARVARKELKGEIAALRKLTSAHRSEIAALKREVKALTSVVKGLQKGLSRPIAPRTAEPKAATAKRRGVPFEFNAEQLAAHRAEFGLTQAQMARLIGASALSVYKWESGKVQPRAAQKEQIAAALKLGKRAVKAKLQAQDE
ncbi:helix-turn-helix domain-containing protein [Hydrogenophaga atypica]|jgi:DNA-binding XRE family transcriptional regulator|uniref:Helix-turn-helix domain-containing protein n=1 Tax=Hydrogenophaga atypica TaxID=249409 RepID=A0ABW2QVQ5_9BURK